MDMGYGLRPFWFWNGDMQDDEIVRQIEEMAEKGIDGFFLSPRQGLTIPYLSEQWFYKVGVAVEAAKKNNVEVWIYDEFPYPSGISGGEVVLDHPEYAAKSLKPVVLEAAEGEVIDLDLPWGEVIMAAAYPVNDGSANWEKVFDLSSYIGITQPEKIYQESGLTAYNRKRFFSGKPAKKLNWQVPSGKWRIYIFMQVEVKHFKYYGNFVDPLNEGAIQYFIQTTHERYRKHFAHEFGKAIKGIFTDEVAPIGNDSIPWSPLLPDLFLKEKGYSLIPYMPALLEDMGEITAKFRYDFRHVVTNQFIKSYDIQVRDWCHKNNLIYAGEKPILRSSQLQYMDIPGIDAGHQKTGSEALIVAPTYRADAKILTSAAHFYNKPRAICENFHSIGWGMTMQDMKWMYDWLAVQGINMFVQHAFFYTTAALAKHDAPPSSFFQMPAWKHNNILSDYVKEVCSTINSSKKKVRVLLVDPITSQWTAMGEKREMKKKLALEFSTLQRKLLENHIDFYIIDAELLGESKIVNNRININEEAFDILILPPMSNLEDCALIKVQEFVENKGTLISLGSYPSEDIGNIKNVKALFEKWAEGSMLQVDDIEQLLNILKKYAVCDISITTDNVENKNVLTAYMHNLDNTFCFMTNITGEKFKANVKIKYEGSKTPHIEQVSLSGETVPIEVNYVLKDNYLIFDLNFSPYQSFLLKITSAKAEEKVNIALSHKRSEISLDGLWDLKVNNLNSLRLNAWKLEIKGIDGVYPVECMPIINQLDVNNVTFPVKMSEYFGCPKEFELSALTCKYTSEFAVNYEDTLYLVMEQGSIDGEWQIKINDTILYPKDFALKDINVKGTKAVDVSNIIRKGNNKIEISVAASKPYHGLVNPLYLCGNFSTEKNTSQVWNLNSLKCSGYFEKSKENGLPFYAGDIIYHKDIDINKIGENITLYIESKGLSNPVTLYINGYCAGTRTWSPYEWEIDKKYLLQGKNHIELQVTSTLIGLFEGQAFDHEKHCYVNI